MSTTKKPAKAPAKPAEPKPTRSAAKKSPTTSKAKPAAKPTKTDHVTTRKGVQGQVCLGGCGKWKSLDEYPKKSAARGGGPLRRCRACIAAERKSSKDAKS
jgi:hypothetical protein